MLKKISTVLLIAVISTFYFSCKHEIPVVPVVPIIPGGGSGGGATSDSVCFQNDILPLLKTSCAKSDCHDAASQNGGYQLDSYANIVSTGITPGNAGDSRIYTVLNETSPTKIMPQPPNTPFTAEQKALIAKWINQGAKDILNCTSGCDTTKFTYAAAVMPILQTNCYGCHSGSASAGAGIILDSYTGVKAMADANKLYPSIAHTGAFPMPQGGSKLSDCNIIQVKRWINEGAKNN